MDINATVEETYARPIEVVFDAIVDPGQMSNYFISGASGPMSAGRTVRWSFDDVGTALDVDVIDVSANERVSFEWQASGVTTRVDIELRSEGQGYTFMRVTESGWPMDRAGIERAMEQTRGWTDFACCMKAYLQCGVDLRHGRVGEASNAGALPERNQEVATGFLDLALVEGDPARAVRSYLAEDFIQHNPAVADGPDALAESIAGVLRAYPEGTWETKRTLVDGDLVTVHGHRRMEPGDPGAAVVNIFRIAGGKIAEQWNVAQPVPESAENDNTMF